MDATFLGGIFMNTSCSLNTLGILFKCFVCKATSQELGVFKLITFQARVEGDYFKDSLL
jgi:hypothetical protein